jgi:5'-3' exonuclease
MGIPSFFVHAVRTYKHIVKPIKSLGVPVSNLYMDCNGLVYNAVRDVKLPSHASNREVYEAAIIRHVCDSITGYVATVAPTNSVFIAFDGVAPAAKLNQQRERRYKTWLSTVIDHDMENKSKAGPKSGSKSNHRAMKQVQDQIHFQSQSSQTSVAPSASDVWSTACITPGTEFMTKLHHEMTRYTSEQSVLMPTVNFILSTSMEPGEGEHKIFEYIREHPVQHRDQVTLVYGLDADLIMLTLNHLHISNRIFLYRETPEFIRSIDSSLRPNEQYYVDIPFMADCIARYITVALDDDSTANSVTEEALTIDPLIKKHLVYDYIFMFFMMGNDFMPHFPSMNIRTNGPTTVMDAYRTVFKNRLQVSIGAGDYQNRSFIEFDFEPASAGAAGAAGATSARRPRINWGSVRVFIEHLAASEQDRLVGEHTLRNRRGRGGGNSEHVYDARRVWGDNYSTAYELIVDKCESADDVLHLPAKERGLELFIAPTKPDWERRYYHALFDEPISDKRCKKYCTNYLEGLEWTFAYYTYGCIDWKWKYEYMYPPLLQDLARFIPTAPNKTTDEDADKSFLLETRPKAPITPTEQLRYVLPPSLQRALIPACAATSGAIHANASDAEVKQSPQIKWAYCKYFWEAHLHF